MRKPAAQPATVADRMPQHQSGAGVLRDFLEGRRLFERETFGGNGRTCLTCHSRETGTVSPEEAGRTLPRTPTIRCSFTTAAMTRMGMALEMDGT